MQDLQPQPILLQEQLAYGIYNAPTIMTNMLEENYPPNVDSSKDKISSYFTL